MATAELAGIAEALGRLYPPDEVREVRLLSTQWGAVSALRRAK